MSPRRPWPCLGNPVLRVRQASGASWLRWKPAGAWGAEGPDVDGSAEVLCLDTS